MAGRLIITPEDEALSSAGVLFSGGDATVGNLHATGNAQVDGNLQVLGTTTIIDSTTISLEDPIVDINRSAGAVAQAGIRILQPSGAAPNKTFLYVTASNDFRAGTEGAEAVLLQAPASAADNALVRFDGTGTAAGLQGYTATAISATDAGILSVTNATASTGPSSGAVVVSGGLGVGERVSAAGRVVCADATASTGPTTGSVVTAGGLGVGERISAAGRVVCADATVSSGPTTGSVVTAGGLGVGERISAAGRVVCADATASTSPGTGSVVTAGGLGVGERISAAGRVVCADATASTSPATGSVVTAGGLGVGERVSVAGRVVCADITASTSPVTGSVVTAGGLGVGGRISTAGRIVCDDITPSASPTTGSVVVLGGLGVGERISAGGRVVCDDATASTSPTTGSVVTAGGLGVGGAINATGRLSGYNFSLNTGTRNTVIADPAPAALTGVDNVVVGTGAGASLAAASNVVAVGSGALAAAASIGNNHSVAVGYRALYACTSTLSSTAAGYQAGAGLTSGDYHVLVGDSAGAALTTASSCTLVGQEAGKLLLGASNTAVGAFALFSDTTTSSGNVAIGKEAARNLNAAASNDNVFVGGLVATSLATALSRRNVFVGASADAADGTDDTVTLGYAATGASGAISIGSGAVAAANEIVLGTTSNTALRVPRFASQGVLSTSATGYITQSPASYGSISSQDPGALITFGGNFQRVAWVPNFGADTASSGTTLVTGLNRTISSTANAAGVARFTTSAAHGLTVGDLAVIHSTTSYNGAFTVTATPLTTTFEVGSAFVANEAGEVSRPSSIAPSASADYRLTFSGNLFPGASAIDVSIQLVRETGTTAIPGRAHVTSNATEDVENFAINLIWPLVSGQRYWAAFERNSGPENSITIDDGCLTIARLL